MTEVDRARDERAKSKSGQKSVSAIANRLGKRRMFWLRCGDGGATERIWVQIAAVMGVMRRHFPQLPAAARGVAVSERGMEG